MSGRSSSLSVNLNEHFLYAKKKKSGPSVSKEVWGAGNALPFVCKAALVLGTVICKSPFLWHPDDCLSDLILIATKKSLSKLIMFSFCLRNT